MRERERERDDEDDGAAENAFVGAGKYGGECNGDDDNAGGGGGGADDDDDLCEEQQQQQQQCERAAVSRGAADAGHDAVLLRSTGT